MAKRLRELRRIASLTQEQAAATLGITFKYYQRLERQKGVEGIRLSTLEQICDGYKITLRQLFDVSPSKPRLARRPVAPPHKKSPLKK